MRLCAPKQMWMLDSPPGTLDEKPKTNRVIKVIAALRAVPMPLEKRKSC